MSSDRLALLDAVREEPHGDIPRRIYADWLDDHGETARAEYIRLALRPPGAEQKARLAALWRKHGRTWYAGFPRGLGKHLVPHGLLLEVDLPARGFLAHGERLMRREPTFSLQLTEATEHMTALAECPALLPVRRLEFRDAPLNESDLATLLSSKHLGNLHDLRFVNCQFGPGHAGVLASSPVLEQLTRLHISLYQRNWLRPPEIEHYLQVKMAGLHNVIRDEGARALAESPYAANLRVLSLCGNYLTEEAGDILGQSRNFKRLTWLDLSYNDLHAGGLAALVASPLIPQIRRLWLQSNEVGPEGAAALVDAEKLADLELLDLSGSLHRVTPLLNADAARSLGRARHFGQLRHLLVGWNDLRGAGARALARAKNFPQLRTLSLRQNYIGADAARALAQSPLLGQLHRLDLIGNTCGIEGTNEFLNSSKIGPQLRLALCDPPEMMEASLRRELRERFGDHVEFEDGRMEDFSDGMP